MENNSKDLKLYSIIQEIRPLYKVLSLAVTQELDGTGITLPMRAVLEDINKTGEKTVPQIAKNLMLDRQPVQRVVTQCLHLNLVSRIKNPEHNKSWIVKLTSTGKKKLNLIRENEQRALSELAKQLSSSQIDVTYDVVNKMRNHFEEFVVQGEKS